MPTTDHSLCPPAGAGLCANSARQRTWQSGSGIGFIAGVVRSIHLEGLICPRPHAADKCRQLRFLRYSPYSSKNSWRGRLAPSVTSLACRRRRSLLQISLLTQCISYSVSAYCRWQVHSRSPTSMLVRSSALPRRLSPSA
jgi:hypothetical protein